MTVHQMTLCLIWQRTVSRRPRPGGLCKYPTSIRRWSTSQMYSTSTGTRNCC